MRTTRGKDQGIAGPTRFNEGRGLSTGANPGLVPTFALNFITEALPAAVTFSRASNATQFDRLGRLVWAPNNQVVDTGFISNWSYTDTTRGAAVTNPPAGEGFTFTEGSVGTASAGTNTVSIISSAPYTVSFHLRGSGWVRVSASDTGILGTNGYQAWFNLSTRTVGASGVRGGGTLISAVCTQLADGWCRVSVSGFHGAVANLQFGVMSASGDGSSTRVSGFTYDIAAVQCERYTVSTPTTFNATSGAGYNGPRFDYNPQTLAARGLLIEEARTNLNPIYQGATTDWTANFCSVTNTGALILGNVAHTYTSIAGSSFCFLTATPIAGFTPSSLYTSSVRVKRGNHPRVQFTVTNNQFLPATADAYLNYNFDTDTLTVLGSSLPAPTGTRTLCADGSVVLTITYTSGTAPTTGSSIIITCVDTDTAVRISGATATVGATVHFFGGQVEAGAFATSLIPTFGTTATRALDSANGAFFGWNATEGTVYAAWETDIANASFFPAVIAFSDGTADNRTHMSTLLTATTIQGIMHSVTGGTNDVNTGLGPAVNGTVVKAAYRLRLNDFAGCTNGGTMTTDTTAQVPPGVNRFDLGRSTPPPAVQTLTRWIREIRYYNTGLTNAQLQAITA